MRAPGFWQRDGGGLPALLLSPLTLFWKIGAAWKRMRVRPVEAGCPVVCVGNLTVGGTGKTPAVMLLSAWFQRQGIRPGVLLRGYGGELSGRTPVTVDPAIHDARQVGDEALLHAAGFPTVICADRVAGAEMLARNCDVILMDDGHQNPALVKDLSIVVADAAEGFGNGRTIPAGPLREGIAAGLGRANAILAIGEGMLDTRISRSALPVLRGRLVPAQTLAEQRVHGFCGIGRPAKFRDTLERAGAELTGFTAFPDHHPFTDDEIEAVLTAASGAEALPVTTTKDAIRLPDGARDRVAVLEVALALDQPEMLDRLLEPVVARIRKP